MIEVAWMNFKNVGMNHDGRVFQIDQNLDHTFIFARRKGKEWMIVEPEVIEDLLQRVGVGHGFIVPSAECDRAVLKVSEAEIEGSNTDPASGFKLCNPAIRSVSSHSSP
jgi:hypothetical protein